MYIFVVGIGNRVDRKELRSIASPGDTTVQDYVFNVTNSDALRDIQELLAIKFCSLTRTPVRTNGTGNFKQNRTRILENINISEKPRVTSY